MTKSRALGYGSLSFILLIAGFLMTSVSKYMFELNGWNLYSNGTEGFHYSFLSALPVWAAAVFFSRKYPRDYGAETSGRFAKLFLTVGVIATFLFLILPLF
ncbi:MAG: hypothetical protein ACE3L7_08280 [Candidatus Pristimantibacillus sp.]